MRARTPVALVLFASGAVSFVAGCEHRRTTQPAQQPPTWNAPPGQPPPGQQPPPAQQPPPQATAPATAPTFPWPFPMPPGFQLPPPPAGWAIPGFPFPVPTATATNAPPVAPPPSNLPGPDARAKDLADRINAYRVSRGLPPVPLSRSLAIVAATHVRDQETNHPDQGDCNQHSWTPTTQWTGCCYTPDHAQASCMWRKPKEITGFNSTGYEVSTKTTGQMTPADALASWQGSPAHHAVIINEGTWAKKPWLAMGTACGPTHAVAWFANDADPAGGY